MIEDDFDIDAVTEERLVLFGPRTAKSLKKLYKEIEENPIFKKCANDELLYAWYVGIPNSPVDEKLPDATRWRMATTRCNIQDPDKKRRFQEYQVSDDVKAAVEEFKKFSPEARMIAQNTTQMMIYNLQEMINVNIKDFTSYKTVKDKEGRDVQVKEIDFQARNAYTSTCAKVAEVMPILVKKLEEGGYGITEIKKSDEKQYGQKPIDKYHEDRKQS
jgi:hypothetical protein